ncbi:MAG TPA: CHAT domain-containing protein, partial [Phycisphaeraceae bacterium]|nr:CHAT domain-containing protein [Phycisphaeraceae bacterium]
CSLNAFTDSVHRSDLVHIACHGRFLPESPLASGLKLSDSWMTVRDVCSLDLNANLVVLSGCETGRNMIGAGDELHGLLRGFFVAGARSLITSLWAVDDETSECFMTSFYRSRRGKGKENIKNSSAMRLAWRTVKEDYPHPSFWAPFVLIGSP